MNTAGRQCGGGSVAAAVEQQATGLITPMGSAGRIALFAALCATAAAMLVMRQPALSRLRRLGLRPPPEHAWANRTAQVRRRAVGLVMVRQGGVGSGAPLGAIAVGLVLGMVERSVVAVLLGAVAAEFLRRRLRATARREQASALRDAVAELCLALATELQAGRTPADALRCSVDYAPPRLRALLHPAVTAAHCGADVAEVFDHVSPTPGACGLRWVAACWRVSEQRGGTLAAALEHTAQSLLAVRDIRSEVDAELAGVRATGRLLAALPAFGLLLGTGSGSQPLHWLLHTGVGLPVLCLGLLLVAGGLVWTDLLAAHAAGDATPARAAVAADVALPNVAGGTADTVVDSRSRAGTREAQPCPR